MTLRPLDVQKYDVRQGRGNLVGGRERHIPGHVVRDGRHVPVVGRNAPPGVSARMFRCTSLLQLAGRGRHCCPVFFPSFTFPEIINGNTPEVASPAASGVAIQTAGPTVDNGEGISRAYVLPNHSDCSRVSSPRLRSRSARLRLPAGLSAARYFTLRNLAQNVFQDIAQLAECHSVNPFHVAGFDTQQRMEGNVGNVRTSGGF